MDLTLTGNGMDLTTTGSKREGTPPSGPSNMEKPSPVFTHQVEHKGILCDNCNNGILGFRYKCCQCEDYDLCSTCERNGIHAGHVMLRIAFPEMAHDAIQSYIFKSRPNSAGFAGVAAAAPISDSELGRKRHCKRERHSAAPNGAEVAPPAFGPQCPVVMGKKEIKKWAKYMKKTAHLHKRMATETLGANAGEAVTNAQSQRPGEPSSTHSQPAFDFSAAASQIQEFLNAFGVPIDVVELYDEWGNRGTPKSEQTTGSTSSNPAQTEQGSEAGTSNSTQPSSSAPQNDLAENLEKMNLGSDKGAREAEVNGASVKTKTGSVVNSDNSNNENGNGSGNSGRSSLAGLDIEGESGWTLLEDDRIDNVIIAVELGTGTGSAAAEEILNDVDQPNTRGQPVAPAPMTLDEAGVAHPTVATTTGNLTSNINEEAPPTPPANPPQPQPPSAPTQQQVSPSLQQVIDGLSATVGNVVRNFSPWNGSNGNARSPSAERELNERIQTTLNQLLSMGFSNHDGWLARLVASKNGNLEEVLNSLFPVGTTASST